ncbi:MAG: flagellar hook-associated protein FlgK [Nitriliruptoraceae bacterium]|nr:flagellar hook-associated protein FlgK [Nitriliruptoraceae bacterium]
MSFVGLYTGLSGLRAAQTGMDTSSHNIANANTPGYTRQRVEYAQAAPYRSAVGWIGTGVRVEDIARLRDQFLDDRFRTAVGDQAHASVRAEFLGTLEGLSGEPDEGLSARITRLWAAAETWSNDPADAASRRQVLTELSSIAEGFRIQADSWDRLGEDVGQRRDTVAGTANQLLEDLSQLNRIIANAQPGRIGPDLFDQRDKLIDQLSTLTGATSRVQPDQSVRITLGGVAVLEGGERGTLSLDGAGSLSITNAAGDQTVNGDNISGELGGLQQVLLVDLPRERDALDQLAQGFAGAINDLNVGTPLLSGPPAGAADMQVLTTDVNALRASLTPGAGPHDGSNARRFADLRNEQLGSLDGRTIEGALADNVTRLAGDVRSAMVRSDSMSGVASGARLARAAEHGVSLDEEMVDLVRFQRALEAAARVMTTVDQALDTLVNRVGIVGR